MSVSVLDCLNDLKAKLSLIPEFTNKIVFAYSEDDLVGKIAGLKAYPGLGLVYDGTHSLNDSGSTAKIGATTEIVFSILLIENGDAVRSTDASKINCITLLDTIRKKMLGIKSPTSHFYHFLVEAPAVLKTGMVIWVQRWSTPMVMTPNNNP